MCLTGFELRLSELDGRRGERERHVRVIHTNLTISKRGKFSIYN